MTDNMKSFLKAVSEDKEFMEKLSKAESTKAVIALAAEKGFALTVEDLTAEAPTGELDDNELDDVAGGTGLFSYLKLLLFGGGEKVEMDTLPYRGQQNGLRANTLEYRGNGVQPQTDDLVYRTFDQGNDNHIVSI